ncbi:hypothetical protein EV641_1463 [Rhodococcus sp. SMB37]|uniref:hypothetical protein n=1 Tax=Rhodococcus sp. SMB37 TaxID=2512213 RepID=UPI00105098EA|nr:hypothetical protein [Rhodococcus sp. SMB37]TCN38215.1 hypothetical protein EV641_1463 [Rhodococcus sp. SMB37]
MTRVIAVYGCFGLALGVLATIGWRYIAPYGSPDYAPIAPELIPPGQEQGFMIEVDHEKYISGPSWLPTAITLPLICTLLGVLAGVLVATLAHRRHCRGRA